MELEDSLPWS